MNKKNYVIGGLFIIVILYATGVIKPIKEGDFDSFLSIFSGISFTSDILIPAIVGVISSASVSVTSYFLFVKFMRPLLIIDDKFVCSQINGHQEFHFKVVNYSRSEAANVRAELHLISSQNTGNGKIARSRNIKLVRSDPMNLASFKKGDSWCATRFITEENLEELWDDNNTYIRLLVHCVHSTSNLGKTFYKEFYRKGHVMKYGEYKVGTEFEIIEYSNDRS